MHQMYILEKNKELQQLNTFRIAATAAEYIAVSSEAMLTEVLQKNTEKKKYILGGGSNILLTADVDGLVIANNITGIEITVEDNNHVKVAVNGGEIWHSFVLWSLEQGYSGIENMSLIPGKVGASPIQNIGAYGVEIKDVCEKVEAIDLQTAEKKIFTAEECKFGYRDSIFKNEEKGKYIITKVHFKLNKKPKLKMDYGDVKAVLAEMHLSEITPKDVSNAIIKIRTQKLPDFNQLGNAGSFFKNPVITKEQTDKLLLQYPLMPHFIQADGSMKIPAGWLIEQCGWKGKKIGNTGAHIAQALVLVNYGAATGQEVYNLALAIRQSVAEKFAIDISPEVNIW